jgi:hypothetical protein
VRDQVSHPYRTRGKTMFLHIFDLYSFRQKTGGSEVSGSKHFPNSICS